MNEVIILSGGTGSRLAGVVDDVPKILASIKGKPFIFYLINYLLNQKIKTFIFSLGYMHQSIISYIKKDFCFLDCKFIIEKNPLGTGGAIKKSIKETSSENILIVNGDTMLHFNLSSFFKVHLNKNSDCTLITKYLKNPYRYGTVTFNSNNQVMSFKEKLNIDYGYINCGVFILNKKKFIEKTFNKNKFSFEYDFLQKYFNKLKIFVSIQDVFFIDIGIPDDYFLAQKLIN